MRWDSVIDAVFGDALTQGARKCLSESVTGLLRGSHLCHISPLDISNYGWGNSKTGWW